MKIVRIIDHNPVIRELQLQTAQNDVFSFQAGQFATLHVPHSPKPVLRAYSFASDDREKTGFTLVFKKVAGGIASEYVWRSREGEYLDFTGPFGRVVFKEPANSQVFLLCTGSGIAQHLSFIKSKADLLPQVRFRLYFGLANEAELFYVEELARLQKRFANLHCHLTLAQPSSQWRGLLGYVQEHLNPAEYLGHPATFYLCGNGEMIKTTRKLLTERDQVVSSEIIAEAFD
ncbi:MAG: phenol 2-monooxygenase [Bdellovibrio sp.]|nr:MAG: phenol 2-monooxygenase [Bdellovibrio sp.]